MKSDNLGAETDTQLSFLARPSSRKRQLTTGEHFSRTDLTLTGSLAGASDPMAVHWVGSGEGGRCDGRHRSNPDRSTAGVRGAGKSRSECGVQWGNCGVQYTSKQFINNSLRVFCERRWKTSGLSGSRRARDLSGAGCGSRPVRRRAPRRTVPRPYRGPRSGRGTRCAIRCAASSARRPR